MKRHSNIDIPNKQSKLYSSFRFQSPLFCIMLRESRTGTSRPVLATRKSGRERKPIVYVVDDDVSEKENQPRSPRVKKSKPKTRKQSEKRKRGEDVVDGLTSDEISEDDSADEELKILKKSYNWDKPVRKTQKPKKPASAVILWGKDNHQRLKDENPDMDGGEVWGTIHSEFNKQPDSVKQQYVEKRDGLMENYEEAMANYESPGESDIEYFTADPDVIKDSGNGRSRRNVQKRKRVRYNPENELTTGWFS